MNKSSLKVHAEFTVNDIFNKVQIEQQKLKSLFELQTHQSKTFWAITRCNSNLQYNVITAVLSPGKMFAGSRYFNRKLETKKRLW